MLAWLFLACVAAGVCLLFLRRHANRRQAGVGVRAMVSTPPMAISIAMTMKVYGRRRARRTIHIAQPTAPLSSCMPLGRRNSRAGGARSLLLLDSSRFWGVGHEACGLVPGRPCRHFGTRAEMPAASRRSRDTIAGFDLPLC